MNLLDFIFPKTCVGCGKFGAYICRKCRAKIEVIDAPTCPYCRRHAVGGRTHPACRKRWGLDGLVVGTKYKGVVRRAISKIKYKFVYDIADELVDILVSNIWRFNVRADSVLVPIPLHASRRKWRGFNQSEILSSIISKKYGARIDNKALVRKRETKPQVGLRRAERLANIKGAFWADAAGVKGGNFILVDDVFTSGATMMEAARVLKLAGAEEVWAMVVAID